MTLKAQLKLLNACREAVNWIDKRDFKTAWIECERGDWMLWLVDKMEGKTGWPTRQQIVLVACDCAELVLPIYEKKYPNDKRVRYCIDITRKWAIGEATIEEVRKAKVDAAYASAYAATDAYNTDTITAYAVYAAAAYAAKAAEATDGTAAYTTAAAAAEAAAYVTRANAAFARFSTYKQCADFLRRQLTVPEEMRIKL